MEADIFAARFAGIETDHQLPFRDAPDYPAVLAAAKLKFRTADDPLDLRHYDSAEVESAASGSGSPQFVVQIGLHNFCKSCGVGIAARYSFDFDQQGKSTGVKLLGLCQGREITQDIAGMGLATFHEFSGLVPQKPRGFSEPYLLLVPGLKECPAHLDF
jgi:hypothetical protein